MLITVWPMLQNLGQQMEWNFMIRLIRPNTACAESPICQILDFFDSTRFI